MMSKFSILSFYRSAIRYKLHTLLNVFGFAVGIAAFIILSIYFVFENSYEKWLPDYRQIYVVQTVWNLPNSPVSGAHSYTMGGLLEQLKQDFPDIIGTRIRGGDAAGSVIQNGIAIQEDVAQVDSSFLQVFDLPMVEKDGVLVLGPTTAFISQAVARKYFGLTDPIGKTLTISMDSTAEYRVAGVFRDIPQNSDFKFSVLISLPKNAPENDWYHWGSTSLQTYLRFPNVNDTRAFEQKLPPFVDQRGRSDIGKDASRTLKLSLLPIERKHLEPEGRQIASHKLTVLTLGLVGVLTLLIALVNYINLASARAGLRAREVAVRKALGADRWALVRQFLGEAILTVALSSLLGLLLAELGLPFVNAGGGLALKIPLISVLPALALLAVIAGIAVGLYPALLLSHFPAAQVLASARAPGGGRSGARVREALVVIQFSLAIAFMISTTVLVAQTRYTHQIDLGFRRDGLFIVRSLADSQITPAQKRAFVTAIQKLPGVTVVALANTAAGGSYSDNSANVPLPGVSGPGPSLRWSLVGPDFFKVNGTRLLAGRVFDDAHGGDDASSATEGAAVNIVIDRRAVAAMGFRSPDEAIGKTVGGNRPRTIIGVVEDMQFFSPHTPRSATYYVYCRDAGTLADAVASIRFIGDTQAVAGGIRSAWRSLVPTVPFDGNTAEKRLGEFYEADDRATRLFGIGAGLAVAIACIGLWGLASFNTARRVKEVGIRKTLGASSPDIVKLLVAQFLRPVLLANLFAWPLAYLAMQRWLTGFQDHVALSPLYFLAATLVATLIAIGTVIGHSLHASRASPAWALRHD